MNTRTGKKNEDPSNLKLCMVLMCKHHRNEKSDRGAEQAKFETYLSLWATM